MGISDIIASVTGSAASAIVSIQDSAFHVKIHGIELGIRDQDDPDTSLPNPLEIRYSQEMEIVIHKTVGQKPLTQCTIPEGLWDVEIKAVFLKGSDGGLQQALQDLRDLTAGPRKIFTALFPGGLCTYLKKKEIVQTKGTKDWYHTGTFSFIEANGGD
jgi:hypothetical protein